jgi:hypothetical protein
VSYTSGDFGVGGAWSIQRLLIHGDIAAPLPHYDQALALYNPATHRRLAIQFVHDARVAVLAFRAWVRWALGFPDAALADANHAPRVYVPMLCGEPTASSAAVDELIALANEKSGLFWQALGRRMHKGWHLA